MGKKWQIRKVNEGYLKNLSRSLSMPLSIARVLMNRGVFTLQEAQDFLEPRLSFLRKLEELPYLKEAVLLLDQVIRKQEKILIFGDYDADGLTAAAILARFLQLFSPEVEIYIPNRFREGYGLGREAVKEVLKREPHLVVTVDCGIRDREGIATLKSQGVLVLITDHHLPDFDLWPQGVCVVSTWDRDSREMISPLSGVGIALALAQAYGEYRGAKINPVEEYLDLACIGTVSDVVPLLGENRVIVRYGLEKLNRNPCCGLRALSEVSGLAGKTIGTQEVGFILAPRINAAGRVEDSQPALDLLLSDKYEEALELANYLSTLNYRRQKEEEKVLESIFQDEKNEAYLQDEVVVISGSGWSQGVLGIVASRLSEQLDKPVIVLTEIDGMAMGSGRSITGFSLFSVLERSSSFLVRYGGHEMAAGLRLFADKVEGLRNFLNDSFAEEVKKARSLRGLVVDALVGLQEVNEETLFWLEKLKPFGEKNPPPLFAVLDASLIKSWIWGKNEQHLRLLVKQGREAQEMVVINGKKKAGNLVNSSLVDLAFEVHRDNSGNYPYLKIQDWRIKK
ncbi:MAG TPA: single-stranded-DNA-specific exonuclease RecJ [Candidatus Atribacteria bacterium]|nr:single-stranded-DNA-specific exonuclease RecJ [Candidatus Atribacteria bacterium]